MMRPWPWVRGSAVSASAHFVYVTDGAPRNEQDSRHHGFASWREYRAARVEELSQHALGCRHSGAAHECLDIPDQEASSMDSRPCPRVSRS